MNMHVSLSRVYTFSAAHRLHSSALDNNTNRQVYDKCNNLYGHGHDYIIEITVSGSPHPQTGFIIPLQELDEAVLSLLNQLDYRYLDREVEPFQDVISTGENIIRFLWNEMEKRLPTDILYHIKLWETNNNYFEIGKEL
ncbi:MAG TPA: 6-carboxytetrahydropterin synthase [Calditrichaeota bacterium]|nr:6-carboxytetrahydropterin synthase [Calditrichota bacterium]